MPRLLPGRHPAGDHARLPRRQAPEAHRLGDLLHHHDRTSPIRANSACSSTRPGLQPRKKMFERGYLEGSEMAGTFNMLRANDLIWSFVVNNYLLGKDPFPFDLLYWNSDSTRMPAAMHSFYLRTMYAENRLIEPAASDRRHPDRPRQDQGAVLLHLHDRRPHRAVEEHLHGRPPLRRPDPLRARRLRPHRRYRGTARSQQVRLLAQPEREARRTADAWLEGAAAPGLVVDRLAGLGHRTTVSRPRRAIRSRASSRCWKTPGQLRQDPASTPGRCLGFVATRTGGKPSRFRSRAASPGRRRLTHCERDRTLLAKCPAPLVLDTNTVLALVDVPTPRWRHARVDRPQDRAAWSRVQTRWKSCAACLPMRSSAWTGPPGRPAHTLPRPHRRAGKRCDAGTLPGCRDPDDQKFLEIAGAAAWRR